jgi:hypothetical protein
MSWRNNPTANRRNGMSIKVTEFGRGDAHDCDDVAITTVGCGETHEWIFQSVKGKDCSDCEEYMDYGTFDHEELSDIEQCHYKVACKKFNQSAVSLFIDE